MGFVASKEVLRFEDYTVGVVRFKERMEALSSAVVGGGDSFTSAVFIMQVPKNYMDSDPKATAARVRDGLGLSKDAVGFMTAAEVDYVFNVQEGEYNGTVVEAIATAGLSNHTIAGDVLENWDERAVIADLRAKEMMSRPKPGTINIIVVSPVPLTMEGKVNMMIPLVEAKTAALNECGFRETGTSSDSMAVVCPIGRERADYAGTASDVGIAAARAVRKAVGYALEIRGEHPVPEKASKILGDLGLWERLVSEVSEEKAEKYYSDFDNLYILDLVAFMRPRVDSIYNDGHSDAMRFAREMIGNFVGYEAEGDSVMEAYMSAVIKDIKGDSE